jgi:hypothetical protein
VHRAARASRAEQAAGSSKDRKNKRHRSNTAVRPSLGCYVTSGSRRAVVAGRAEVSKIEFAEVRATPLLSKEGICRKRGFRLGPAAATQAGPGWSLPAAFFVDSR